MSEFMMIYVTCGTKAEAENILLTLLGERLVACGNISAPVTSYYHWDSKIETSEEVAMLLKTKTSHFKAVEERIAEMHSYDVPCIVGLDIHSMNGPYKKWLDSEVR